MDFEEFLDLCRDADKLLDSLKNEPRLQGRAPRNLRLQGRAPRNLKPAAIHLLARERGQHVTMPHLYVIYGIDQARLIEIKKLLQALLNKKEE